VSIYTFSDEIINLSMEKNVESSQISNDKDFDHDADHLVNGNVTLAKIFCFNI
jgi:hypothetical protein